MKQRLKSLALSALVFGAPFFMCELSLAALSAPPPKGIWLTSALSLDKAAKKIRKQTGGKILSAKKTKKGNRIIYKIKVLLPNGKVKVFSVDPDKG